MTRNWGLPARDKRLSAFLLLNSLLSLVSGCFEDTGPFKLYNSLPFAGDFSNQGQQLFRVSNSTKVLDAGYCLQLNSEKGKWLYNCNHPLSSLNAFFSGSRLAINGSVVRCPLFATPSECDNYSQLTCSLSFEYRNVTLDPASGSLYSSNNEYPGGGTITCPDETTTYMAMFLGQVSLIIKTNLTRGANGYGWLMSSQDSYRSGDWKFTTKCALLANLHGNIFNDLNGDGSGNQETGAANVQFVLKNGTDEIARVVSNPFGDFSFSKIPYGSYTLDIDTTSIPAGAIITTHNIPANIVLFQADQNIPIAIGLQVPPSGLCGGAICNANATCINDQCECDDLFFGDGVNCTYILGSVVGNLFGSALGFPSINVTLDDSEGTVVAQGSTFPDGTILFNDLAPGTYTVKIEKSINVNLPWNNTAATYFSVQVELKSGVETTIPSSFTIPLLFNLVPHTNTSTTTLPASAAVTLTSLAIAPTSQAAVTSQSNLCGGAVCDGNATCVSNQCVCNDLFIGNGVTCTYILGGVTGNVYGLVSETDDKLINVTLLDAQGVAVADAVTASDGSFDFEDLAEGNYTVVIVLQRNPEFGLSQDFNPNTTVVVKAGTVTPVSPDFNIYGLGRIVGSVVGANQTPMPGVNLTLIDINNSVLALRTTEADGSFTFEEISAGSFTISVDPTENDALPAGYKAGLTVSAVVLPCQLTKVSMVMNPQP